MATATAEALYQALQRRHTADSQGQTSVTLADFQAVDGLAQAVALTLRAQGPHATAPKEPNPDPRQARLKDQLQDVEIGRIRQALAAAGGNQSEAARALRMKRSTLLSKMKKHGL